MTNLPGLNFQLGDDVDALRDAVRDFAQAEIAPRAAERAHLLPQVHRELVGAVDLGGTRRDLGLREIAHRVAQRVHIVAELEVEAGQVRHLLSP